MSNLLQSITGALEGIDILASIDGEVENLNTVVNTVNKLAQGDIPELGDFVQSVAEIELPSFDFASDLIGQVDQVRNVIPTDLGDVLSPITDSIDNMDSSLGDGIDDILQPLLEAFAAINTLSNTNFSFGSAESGGSGGSSETTSLISSNTDTQVDPARLQAFSRVVSELPSDPSVSNLLAWLNSTINIGRNDMIEPALRSIPFLDDIRVPLDAVLSWQSMSSSDLQLQIIQTVETLATVLNGQLGQQITTQFQQLNALVQLINPATLHQNVEDTRLQLVTLKSLIDAGTLDNAALTTIESALVTLKSQRDSLITQFTNDVKTPLDRKLKIVAKMPSLLEEKMASLIVMLQPPISLQIGDHSTGLTSPPQGASAFDGIEGFLDQYVSFFEDLLASLDISAVTNAFLQPAEAIENAVREIEEAITMVTLEITNRLNQVRDLIASLDLPGIVDRAEEAINQFVGDITGALAGAFADVKNAIETLANQIISVISSFNPAGIVNGIESGIDAITAELQRPEIANVLEVLEKLKSIAERLDRVSFTPVTDTVVGTIDDMASAVQGLGSNLDDPLKDLLSNALGVLPRDLHPVTDPLVEGISDIIDAGPIPLLEAIKDGPQEIVDTINNFDPEALIGDTLSGPFQNLISEIQGFEANQLLEPIAQEIENFKNRVKENANPGQLLDPLIEVHEGILRDMEGFKPDDLIEPVNQALTSAIAQLTDALPVDDVFDGIQSVIDNIERILGTDGVADSILNFIQTVRDYLDPFVNASEGIQDQINDWLNSSLTPLDAVDLSSLQTPFSQLVAALDNAQAAAIQTTYSAAIAPINTALKDTLKPSATMTAFVKTHGKLNTASATIADAGLKTRVALILTDFNPTAPDFSQMLTSYGRAVTTTTKVTQDLENVLLHWDQQFLQPGGVLATYRQVPASVADLKQWIIDSLQNQLVKPLLALFEKLAPTGKLLDAFLTPIVTLINALRDAVNQIIAAPAAVVDVANSLQDMIANLQDINLDFISDSIDSIYDEVKIRFRELDPRGLKNTINEAFERVLELIDINQVVPVNALNQADDSIDQALADLRKLDPSVLITEVIKPKFDETLAPFVSAMDLTPALTALSERLKLVESELKEEMDRVNTAYQGFISSAPA